MRRRDHRDAASTVTGAGSDVPDRLLVSGRGGTFTGQDQGGEKFFVVINDRRVLVRPGDLKHYRNQVRVRAGAAVQFDSIFSPSDGGKALKLARR